MDINQFTGLVYTWIMLLPMIFKIIWSLTGYRYCCNCIAIHFSSIPLKPVIENVSVGIVFLIKGFEWHFQAAIHLRFVILLKCATDMFCLEEYHDILVYWAVFLGEKVWALTLKLDDLKAASLEQPWTLFWMRHDNSVKQSTVRAALGCNPSFLSCLEEQNV